MSIKILNNILKIMEDKLSILAKQLVENKSEDMIKLYNSLTNFDKFCLNKFYNMDFKNIKSYSDEELWFDSSHTGYVKIIQHFIDKGIDVNCKDSDNYTALTNACFKGNIEVIKLLLQHPSIDVNPQDSHGYTSLMWSILSVEYEVIKLLLQHPNININLQDSLGWTALTHAYIEYNDEVVVILLQHKDIDVNIKDNNGETVFNSSRRLENPQNVINEYQYIIQ